MADASGLRRKVLQYGQRVAVGTAKELERELRRAADQHYKTGELDQSIKVVALGSGPRYRLHAEAPVVQASTTNKGARPHVIRARNARTLSFYWPKVGRVVNPVSVNHPGNKGSGWWDKVMRGPVLRRAITTAKKAA